MLARMQGRHMNTWLRTSKWAAAVLFALVASSAASDSATDSMSDRSTSEGNSVQEAPRNVGRPRPKSKVTTENMASYTADEPPPQARFASPRGTQPRSYTYQRYGAGGEAQRVAFERMHRR